MNWPSKARALVGSLRLTAARFPDDAALHALVGELSAKGGEFASMWPITASSPPCSPRTTCGIRSWAC
ncbi:MmyB family transcriptional regulator [Streptomyces sp. NBC_01478]|uniref:MmyB family transcriptional regulator n=1 Tax=Streptomyces sp. NBC_01478 TaxID=2903882 RepID=UPI003FCCB0BE